MKKIILTRNEAALVDDEDCPTYIKGECELQEENAKIFSQNPKGA